MSTEQAANATTTIGENVASTTPVIAYVETALEPVETSLQPVVPETVGENTTNQTAVADNINKTEEPSAGDTNVTTASETETPKAPEEDKAPSPTTANQKGALFSNIPNFLKKPFEKKHDDAAAPTTTDVTGEHANNVPSEHQHHDKSENRLSRTILDLLHKKPVSKSDEGTAKDEAATPAAVNETTEEGNATTPTGEPSSPKEPFIDHLRRLFTPKKSTETTTETTETTDNAAPADNAPTNNTEEPSNAPVESSNVNEGTPKNEEPKTSLTRRISTMAQHWSSKLKENSKKQKAVPEATTTTNEQEPVTTATETTEATEAAPESHPVSEPTTEPKPTTTEAPLTSSAPPVQASA